MKPLLFLLTTFFLCSCQSIERVTSGPADSSSGNNDEVRILQVINQRFNVGVSFSNEIDTEYHNTGTQITFTPRSSRSKILITISGTAMVFAHMEESPCDISIFRNETDLLSPPNARAYRLLGGGDNPHTNEPVDVQVPVTITHTDENRPIGIPIVYSLRIRAGDGPVAGWRSIYHVRWCKTGGNNLISEIRIMEIESKN